MIVIITLVGFLATLIVQFTGVLKINFFTERYGLNSTLIDFRSDFIIVDIITMSIIIVLWWLVLFSIHNIFNKKSNKCKNKMKEIAKIYLFNLFFILSIFSTVDNVFEIHILMFISIFIQYILSKIINFNELNINTIFVKDNLSKIISKSFFILLSTVLFLGILNYILTNNKRTYEFISENQVIIYSSIDYCLVQKYKIVEEELVIYKDSYQKYQQIIC